MTSHYADIALRGDEETHVHEVLDIAFNRLHRAFVQERTANVGISFPRLSAPGPYVSRYLLGDVIRLHGSEEGLRGILESDWSTNLADYVAVSAIRPAPAEPAAVRLLRAQARSNTQRLIRRAMKRHGLTEEKAREQYGHHAPERLDLPYVFVRSASRRQSFRLYLKQEAAEAARGGTFSAYGLSVHGGPTVPYF